MPPLTGFLATLPEDTILEAGVLYINSDTPFGVSRGGLAFDPAIEWENLDFDDKVYPITGLDRKTGGMAKISGTIIELSDARMSTLEAGEVRSGAAADFTYAPNAAGDFIADGVYLANVRVAYRRGSGGFVIVKFPLALLTKYQVKGANGKGAAEIAIEIESRALDAGGAPTYEIHFANTTQEGPPSSSAQLITSFNALNTGTDGATMLALYTVGVNQTIVPNGDASLASPATNSPTGFWCTKWDEAVTPNQGRHFRPSAGVNGGNGAPCLETGEICGVGLEVPDASGLTGGALFHADPGKKTDAAIPGSGNLRAILGDYSAGITWGGVGKMLSGCSAVHVGEDADANRVEGGLGDDFGNICGLRNSDLWEDGAGSGANVNAGGVFGNGGTPIIHWACTVNRTTEPEAVGGAWENWRISLIGRDMVFPVSMGTNDLLAAGRRLRLGGSYGSDKIGQQRAQSVFYVLKGHCNAAQTKMLCDYFDTNYATYNDTRRLGYLFGDSEFVEKINLDDQMLIQGNENGGPAIANFGYFSLAFSGMRPQLMLHPLTYYLRGCDFSKRPAAGVPIVFSEWINATPTNETLADTIAQNYYCCDVLRAIDPTRIRIAMHNMCFADDNFDNQQTLNDPAVPNDLAANAVAGGHADVVIDYLRSVMWDADPQFYGPVGDYNRAPSSGTWNGIHPFHIGQRLWFARLRTAFRAAMGEDVSNVTVEAYSSLPVVNLSAGAPTATPAWTPKNKDGAAIGGKAFSFSSWKHVPAQSHDDETLDTSVCTVDPASGQITRVAPGVALVVCDVNDGGRGICVVSCT